MLSFTQSAQSLHVARKQGCDVKNIPYDCSRLSDFLAFSVFGFVGVDTKRVF